MRILILLVLSIATLLLTACNDDSPDEKAEVKLRNRVEAWYNKDDRSGVTGGQCAVSCHTTIPFMLMNPMESVEDRVTADGFQRIVSARVSDWENLQPLYSWAEEDSRSTEALLNVVSLLEYDRKVNRALSNTTCKALDNLWALQQSNGGFLWLDTGLSPWEDEYAPVFASSMLALSLARVSKLINTSRAWASCEQWDNQTDNVASLYTYLKGNYSTANKHAQVWFLWANEESDYQILMARDHAARITSLFPLQHDDGGFDLKDFGPFDKNVDSPAMSQPYITGLMIKVLAGADGGVKEKAALLSANMFMSNYKYNDIDTLRSLNNPASDWNNGLFQDANLAFYLGMKLSD